MNVLALKNRRVSINLHTKRYSRCGPPDDVKYLVDKAHSMGISILLDVVGFVSISYVLGLFYSLTMSFSIFTHFVVLIYSHMAFELSLQHCMRFALMNFEFTAGCNFIPDT